MLNMPKKIMYYGFVYLYDNKKYDEAITYLNENIEYIKEELQNDEIIEYLLLLLKIRKNDTDFNKNEIFDHIKNLDISKYPLEQTKLLIFSILFYIYAFIFIDYNSEFYEDSEFMSYLNNFNNNIPKNYENFLKIWHKTIKVWKMLTPEMKNDFMSNFNVNIKNNIFSNFSTEMVAIYMSDNTEINQNG